VLVKTIQSGLLTVTLSMLALNLCGCSGSDRPELGLVVGTITLDDKPVSGIVVVFQPDEGRPARGKTDQEGHYELTYIAKTPGCKVGHNRVQIAPNEEGEDESTEAADTESAAPPKRSKPGKVEIPAHYNTKSELEADVQPGENVFDFHLVSKVKVLTPREE
jgi:hypothetical protein